MLTNAQLATLKAHIAANTATVLINGQPTAINAVPVSPDNCQQIATWYAGQAPDFYVWKTNVSTYDIRAVVVWAEYDALSSSKQTAFQFLCSNGIVNAGLTNVRQGITSIFSGPSQSGNLAAMIAVAKRLASHAEKLFATGVGTNASPATMAVEGELSYLDVLNAMNLPA